MTPQPTPEMEFSYEINFLPDDENSGISGITEAQPLYTTSKKTKQNKNAEYHSNSQNSSNKKHCVEMTMQRDPQFVKPEAAVRKVPTRSSTLELIIDFK